MKPLQKKTVLKTTRSFIKLWLKEPALVKFNHALEAWMRGVRVSKSILNGRDQRLLNAFTKGYVAGFEAKRSDEREEAAKEQEKEAIQ